MKEKEFFDKVDSVEVVEPDKIDILMLKEAETVNDGTTVDLEEFKKNIKQVNN
ncbi:MAG: hypothetical protein GYA87_09850 [Christensenellaceae bacterium]|nr:hypothetical protein [Christensenellaceae bacterium]